MNPQQKKQLEAERSRNNYDQKRRQMNILSFAPVNTAATPVTKNKSKNKEMHLTVMK